MGSTEYSMMMDWSPVTPAQPRRGRLNLRGSTIARPANQYEPSSVRRYKQDRRDLQLMKYYDSPNRPIRVRNPIPQDVASLTRKRKRLYVENKRPTPVRDELERRDQERIEKLKRQDEGDVLYTRALQASPFNDDTDEGDDNRDENLRNKRQRTTPPSDEEEEVDMTFGEMLYETAQVTIFSICSIPLLAAAGLKRGLNALVGRQTEERLPLDGLWWEPTPQIKPEEPPTTSQAAFDSGVELASVSSSAPSVSTDETSVGDVNDEGTTHTQITEDAQDKPGAQLTTNGDDLGTRFEKTPVDGQRVADTIAVTTPDMDYSIEQEDLGQIIEKVERGIGHLRVQRFGGRKTIDATPSRELRKSRPIHQPLSSRYQEREKEREEERRKIKADVEKRERERLAAIKAAQEAEEKKKLQRILPDENFIQPLNAEWVQKIQALMKKGHGATLARTSAGIEIKLHSFQTLLPQRGDLGWLDDEIINGYMQAIVDFGNGDVILDGKRSVPRRNTPPRYHTFNSFFYENLSKKGPASIARWSKRAKIDGEKLLQVEYIYIPLHLGNHWTLAVVSGTKRTIEYFDSLGGRPDQHIAHIKAWLKNELGDNWKEEEWKVLPTKGPKQRNGYDCGVFTVTTAKCIMLGIDPMAYSQEDIHNQRLRMAAELSLGGFVNEFAPPWPPGGGK